MSATRVAVLSSESSTIRKTRRKSKNNDLIAEFERSDLYKCINEANEESWITALDIVNTMTGAGLRQKSLLTGNTYLHEVIIALSRLHRNNNGDIRVAIVLVYRLALCGSDVNAQNELGNTCLHLACFRPLGEIMSIHLLRLGMAIIFISKNTS